MQGYHDMRDDEEPKWMLYAAFFGLGLVAGLLGAQIISVLS